MTNSLQSQSNFEKRLLTIFCILITIPLVLSVNLPRSFAFFPGAVATLVFALYWFNTQTKPIISKKTAALVAIILTTSTLSLLWAEYPEETQKKILKLIPFLLPQILLITLATSLKSEQLQALKKIVPITYLIAVALLIFEILNQGFLHNILRGEDISVVTDHDDFNRGTVALALYAIPTFILLKMNLKKVKFAKLYAALIIFAPLFFAISISQSQASLMSLSIGLLFLFCFPYNRKSAITIIKYAAIIITLSAPFFMPYIYENFAQSIQNIPVMANGYAGHRLEIWDYVSRYALQQPILGYGVEATREIMDFDSKMIFKNNNTVLHPHNYVLQIWIELGLLGVLILCALTYAIFTNIQKNHTIEQQKLLLPTLIAVMLTASVAYGLWQGAWMGIMFHVAAITFMTNTLLKSETTQH